MPSRRFVLATGASLVAERALALAPAQSLRPVQRPGSGPLSQIPTAEALLERANLGGRVGFAVADARSGRMLEVLDPLHALPPASVAKAVTCAYGLDRLGPGHRFHTQLIADGTLENGRLEGDLWLAGTADPTLDTDDLGAMASALRQLGLREVTGRLVVSTGPLPTVFEIDGTQPDHAGYNPSVAGLNLNFNRVYFEWQRSSAGYQVSMDARSSRYQPAVQVAQMEVVERGDPVYEYAQVNGIDRWSVARGALGGNGSRWLPVRRPVAYTAEVFRSLARSNGITFREAVLSSDPVPASGTVLIDHVSDPLEDILRGMMRWSTNLTAEVVGMLASQAGGPRVRSLAASGRAMGAWMQDHLGARRPVFVDHSGLGDQSRIHPEDMTRALATAGPDGLLKRLMRDVRFRDAQGAPMQNPPFEAVAKTGTLNFVSSLAGYARTPAGRDLAFTIFCADMPRRAAVGEHERERPPGARSYNTRAKVLQQALLERWVALYDRA